MHTVYKRIYIYVHIPVQTHIQEERCCTSMSSSYVCM